MTAIRAKILSAVFILLTCVRICVAQPAEVILLRHAEKPPDESNVHLSATGKERSRALVKFFATAPELTTNGPPIVLFAARPVSRKHSNRPAETLEPLAKHLKLRVQIPYTAKEYAALARKILHDPAYKGKTVVVCWVHDELAELAGSLGVKPRPAPWKSNVFDRVWVITYRGKEASLFSLPQKLLSGDSER
jgi:hypothetical protein